MYEAVSGLLEVFSAMFQGYCLQYFFGSFLETRIRNRRINELAVTVLYGVLRLGVGFFLPKSYGSFGTFVKLAAIMCIVLVVVLLCYRAIEKITLFLIGAFMAVNEISFFLSYMIFKLEDKLFSLWDWEIVSERMPSLEVYYMVSVIMVIGLNLLRCVAASALLYLSLKRIIKDYREKDYLIHRTELLFILAPALVSLMICTLLRVTVETTENSIPELLYDRYPSLII